jgi:hypothetical protein
MSDTAGTADKPQTPPPPTRKRPYRDSITDESMDESIEELDLLMMQDLSPTTMRSVQSLKNEVADLISLAADDPTIESKKRELLRSELFTQTLLAKDAKHSIIAAKYVELLITSGL